MSLSLDDSDTERILGGSQNDSCAAQSVFVVTAGEYSDYHIVGIYATRQEAEASGYPAECVEEWTLGAPRWKNGREWHVVLDVDTGNLRPEYCSVTAHEHQIGDRGRAYLRYDRLLCAHSHVSEEHALKLAAELRQRWLRAGKPSHIDAIEDADDLEQEQK